MIRLNFETITPLHISNGNQLAYNLEYIANDGYLSKLNTYAKKRMAEYSLFDFSKEYNFRDVAKIIGDNKNIFDDSCFEYKVAILDSFEEFLNNERRDGQKIVQEFINSNGKFYVPGSSVKGMLTTILGRDENNPLGINPKEPYIQDKFVITDSEFIPSDNFVVDIAYRPPSINLIVLDVENKFSCEIRSIGNLSLKKLQEKLSAYSHKQLRKAKNFVEKFKEKERKPGGATNYFKMLEKMVEYEPPNDTYLVNLGFGGGSYYKIYDFVPIPKFPSKRKKNIKEEAHTTFAVNIDNNFYQLGWCELKIEE